MILADSSAWIEYLRRTGSAINVRLRSLIELAQLATPEPVAMKILAGARDDEEHRALRRMLAGVEFLPVQGFEQIALHTPLQVVA